MKHFKKVTVVKTVVAKANVFDDIGNWFHDIGGNDKKR
jgi:hypothetical protein